MAVATKAAGTWASLSRWAFTMSGYNKYGLYLDDVLYETPDVEVALKRLPQRIIDERNFRQIRAAQCSIQKIYLPKEQWTTYEDDRNNRYLSPIVEQVKKEREEREAWDADH